ncbi:KRAB-A domain-containing protein 2-like isoform X1 [Solenopsis invicta]|uniref:KRAB-A domain-containing protein 2-like isoform X1 n=1 Tax=Solenopsis invicta TaxID=13686 RepID=UPI00193CB249|nr:KRAB-A domain-containing protein 2-like isoform X1 [Solenopsis invicta]
MWLELSIVHGKPRHSQSQGSVERANQDVQKILFAWVEDNKTNRWSEGLKFCQVQKNCAYHTGIRQTPFEVMFERKAHVGIQTLPDSIKKILRTEEELESTYIGKSIIRRERKYICCSKTRRFQPNYKSRRRNKYSTKRFHGYKNMLYLQKRKFWRTYLL